VGQSSAAPRRDVGTGGAAAVSSPGAPREEITGGADRGPRERRMAWGEPGEELLRSPTRMLPARVTDHAVDLVEDPVWTVMRRAAAIAKSRPPMHIETGEPLGGGLPTDAGPGAGLDHGVQAQLVVAKEPFTLFHRCCLQPGHRSTSVDRAP